MLKALTTQVSNTPRSLAALAAVFFALTAGDAVASARSAVEAPARVAPAVQQAGWESRGHHVRPRLAVPRVIHPGAQRHGHHRKFHKPQTFRGQGHKRLYPHGQRLYGQACRPVKVVGWHRGHRALFGQVLCVNRFGQRSYMRGSRYLIRYLHH